MLQRPSLPHTPGPQPPASPPHNPYPHIPPLKPRKSPLPPPSRRTQVVTSTSPLCHVQVRCHHPVMVRKTRRDTAPTPSQHGVQARLRRQPAPQRPHHSATPTWHASPATTPTHRAKTSPPQHSAQVPPRQPVAHEPRRDATCHGTTQKPHQPAVTPLCTSPALLTSY